MSECRWCGHDHGQLCPFVKALEFDGGGRVVRVEFLTPADTVQRAAPAEEPPDYQKLVPKGA